MFDNVLWSNEKTCDSQITAIRKCNINVVKSKKVFADVDEMEDWLRLCRNFGHQWDENDDVNRNQRQNILDYNSCFPNVTALLLKAVQ